MAHRFLQWTTVFLVVALLLWGAISLWNSNAEEPFPSRVRIATGNPRGEYYAFGEAFATQLRTTLDVPVEVVVTEGAVDNRNRLIAEETELSLLQSDAVSNDDLAVVAPLYPEAVFFVVRTDLGISRVAQLASRKVAIGPAKSGMQLSARRIFDQLGIQPEYVETSFSALAERFDLDAAVITTGPHNGALLSLLRDARFRLLSLELEEVEELEGPMFRPATIDASTLTQEPPDTSAVLSEDIRTIRTTTFLVARRDCSSDFVRVILESLYSQESLAEAFGLLSRKQAAQWTTLPLHPAAREFFAVSVSKTQ